MKKLLGFLICFGFIGYAHAISPVNEDENVTLHYSNQGVTSSTNVILVDLSDTSSFKTRYTGHIVISDINLVVERAGNAGQAIATGTVKIGVVNYVGASTGSVSYFFELPLYQSSNTAIHTIINKKFSPSFLRTKVIRNTTPDNDGTTPYFVTNTSTSSSTAFQTDLLLTTSLGGSVTPRAGDLILSLVNGSSNIFNVSLDINYHSER